MELNPSLIEAVGKVSEFFANNRARLRPVGVGAFLIYLSYLIASSLNVGLGSLLIDEALKPASIRRGDDGMPAVPIARVNYRDLSRAIVGRNLFNSTRELPEESDPSAGDGGEMVQKFDENAPCKPSTLNLELVGTIYLNSTTQSLATVREKGYNMAEVYRAGDEILGHEPAVVYRVEPTRLVINNNGAKECLELVNDKAGGGRIASLGTPNNNGLPQPASNNGGGGGGDAGGRVVLESSYVEEALGPGYAKILQVGRLVPHNDEGGKTLGYKLIGVRSNSIWRKMKLNSGDVITNVNGTSLAQLDQGFILYESLQNDKEIVIEFLQGGNSPTTVTVEVK